MDWLLAIGRSSAYSDRQRSLIHQRYGTYSVDLAVKAGLDLEMPGPSRWRTPLLLTHMLSSRKVLMQDIDDRASTVLSLVKKLATKNPDIVYGGGTEKSRDTPETRKFCRQLTSETIVLLKNSGDVLPLRPDKVRTIAVIGSQAKDAIISGGGSAALKPSYTVSPWDGILSNAAPHFDLKYAYGCHGNSVRF